MLSSIIDKMGALLSRSFILANFFPFLIFAVVNIGTAWIALPETREAIEKLWKMPAAEQAVAYAAAFIAMAIVAYVVSPLTVVVHRTLEGELFVPRCLRRIMEREQRAEANRLRDAVEDANDLDNKISDAVSAMQKKLTDARRKSNDLNTFDANAQNQIETAETNADTAIERARSRGSTHGETIAALEAAVTATVTALEHNRSRVPDGAPDHEKQLAAKLRGAQGKLTPLLRQAGDDARQVLVQAQNARRGRFALKVIRPTRIANVRAAAESYSADAYGIEFDYLWPRLRLALQKNEKTSYALDTAKAQVDFSVLMVLLCFLFTAAWVVILTFVGHSPLTLIVIGIAGQWAILLFFRVVEESVKQLGELVGAMVDLNRFDLLRQLDIDLPGTLTAERALWRRLQGSSSALGVVDIAYRHAKP
jgi:hypothetical protein